jgi:hypothetical protein
MNKAEREALSRELCKELGKGHPDDPTPPMKKCRMRCGHEDTVHAGVDPAQRDCWICICYAHNPTGAGIGSSARQSQAMKEEQLANVREWVGRLSDQELQNVYLDQVKGCRFERGAIPDARQMQQLVQIWRELWKRKT